MAAVSRVLRNAAGQAGKSAPMSADSSLYHFEPQVGPGLCDFG
jgi:hypothetical protein